MVSFWLPDVGLLIAIERGTGNIVTSAAFVLVPAGVV